MCSALICFGAGFGIIAQAGESLEGAKSAVESCARVLIPGIFPFMVITQFALYTGAAQAFALPFGTVTEKVYKLPKVCSGVIILSLIGGYPVGAKMISTLYKQRKITQKQASRMALFCFGAGPAFVMGTVGAGILKNSGIGIIIFVSQLSASIITGLCVSVFCKEKPVNRAYRANNKSFGDAFTLAVKDAAAAVINMCAFVIFFGSVMSIIKFPVKNIEMQFHLNNNTLMSVAAALCEVTNACVNVDKSQYPVLYAAFAVGFGGLCVHCQIFSLLEGIKVNKAIFLALRVVQGILSALFTYILCSFFPFEAEAAYIFGNEAYLHSGNNIFSAVTLIIMCVVFVVSQHEKREKTTKRES